ncbi:TPA: hypothetical protein NJZ22_003961 [Vibrio parahaemolyticus]|nr:hypothetical protein [Vibrio parahaemolyticus]
MVRIPGKDDKASRTIYEQIAYAYLGGKFPVEMKLSLEKDWRLSYELYRQGLEAIVRLLI